MTDQTVEQVLADMIVPANVAILSTLLPGGGIQSHVVWLSYDGLDLMLNTERHRQKHRNVARDPSVTVTVVDHADPHRFVEVRGHVAELITGAPASDHVDHLSRLYRGRNYEPDAIRSERVLLRIKPDRCVYVTGPSYRVATVRSAGPTAWSAARQE